MSLKLKTIITDEMKYLLANEIYIKTSLDPKSGERLKMSISRNLSSPQNLLTVEAERKISQLFSLGKTIAALKSYSNWFRLGSGVNVRLFSLSHIPR